jgi:hypothetical protein
MERLEHDRLARECAKLDPAFEKALAEEGLSEDLATWPECSPDSLVQPSESIGEGSRLSRSLGGRLTLADDTDLTRNRV